MVLVDKCMRSAIRHLPSMQLSHGPSIFEVTVRQVCIYSLQNIIKVRDSPGGPVKLVSCFEAFCKIVQGYKTKLSNIYTIS